MTKTAIVERLLRLSFDLQQAEESLLRETVQHAQAKWELEELEARTVLLHGADLGRNDLERKAKLHLLTLDPQEQLQKAGESRDRAAMILRSLQAEAALLRSVARLLAAAGERSEDG